MEKGFTITYEYGDNLYVNPTNRCNFNCEFCLRHNQSSGGSIYTHNLWLKREPTKEEILSSIESWDLSKHSSGCSWASASPPTAWTNLLGCRPVKARVSRSSPHGHHGTAPSSTDGTSPRSSRAGSTWCPCR